MLKTLLKVNHKLVSALSTRISSGILQGINLKYDKRALNKFLWNFWNIIFKFQSPGEAAILIRMVHVWLLWASANEAWGGQWWVNCRIRDYRYGSLVFATASGVTNTNNTTRRWKSNRALHWSLNWNMPDADYLHQAWLQMPGWAMVMIMKFHDRTNCNNLD